jgi:hypothetical protein
MMPVEDRTSKGDAATTPFVSTVSPRRQAGPTIELAFAEREFFERSGMQNQGPSLLTQLAAKFGLSIVIVTYNSRRLC